MSTFDGIVKEIPFISVDRFNIDRKPMPKIFFLTHCHTDHTKYINNLEFQKKLVKKNVFIYATGITITVLKRDNNVHHIHSQLKEIEVGKTTIIKYKDDDENEEYLQVTAIAAGHCPGSVMFLFENDQNVLCTGDFRINPLDLQKFKVFHTSTGKIKNIDTIYIDSTFFSKNYPYFASRVETCNVLCETVKDWLDQSPDHKVYLQFPAKYSAEYLFIALSEKLKEKIHVHPSKDLYSVIPDLDNITSSEKIPGRSLNNNYRIHSGRKFKPDNSKDSCCIFDNVKSVLVIHLTAWIWDNFSTNKSPINWISENDVRICLSFHPSYTETIDFLKYLKPKRVELCVVPENEDEKDQMEELLENVLREIWKETENKEGNVKRFKFKAHDSFEFKENDCDDKSAGKLSINDDLLSSPPRKKRI